MPESAAPANPGWGLVNEMHALIDADDPRFTFHAPVSEAAHSMVWLTSVTRLSVWNMQRHSSTYDLRHSAGLNATLRERKVELRLVLPRRVAEERSPLATSMYPNLRLAPVAHPLLISDGRLVLAGDSTGEAIWTSTDVGVVHSAVRFYEGVWDAAEPGVPPGKQPPFTRRMIDIAFHLIDGATDREIARAVGVSERTVSADVREMSNRIGARSRTQAIALIAGI